ncbi:MAG: nitroreductase family deazaflavin-dependent oxidoreductase [Acidimicrobiia bacterium]|nr:nitroreductase family deazaflavin-dependent oxidoreductase [Acidimicrobiia bacterium]
MTLWTILLIPVAAAATFMAGMRYKWPFVLDAVRRLNRRFLNPRQMRTAGSPGAYAGIILHTGRSSGREYETPVGIVPIDDSFVIVLPYGTRPDWVKNVLAAGTATLTHEGSVHAVERPEIVPTADILDGLDPSDRRAHDWFNVQQSLRLHPVTVRS